MPRGASLYNRISAKRNCERNESDDGGALWPKNALCLRPLLLRHLKREIRPIAENMNRTVKDEESMWLRPIRMESDNGYEDVTGIERNLCVPQVITSKGEVRFEVNFLRKCLSFSG